MRKQHRHIDIIDQVPVDYYQKGIENNVLQKVWHTNKYNAVFELITTYPQKILDVGCSSGWFISEIAKRFPKAKCYGIDLYNKAIAYGRRLYPNIEFQLADVHEIPFRKNTFDLVICTEVLEHVDDPKRVLLEIKRVLKDNGVAIIELDSGSLLFNLVWFVWTKLQGRVWNDAHLHSFDAKKLNNLFSSCKFRVIEKKKFNFGMAMIFVIRKHE